ncbi:unnamed protein product [Brachionus calyciflorus]|uniref:Uncharacterized protein n=1 Tax=Brachionus calyciflorus TaxID=104777 RepID=A0A814M3I9_9BILA|nr:unnamed protein product [Brachionus calyciflorus]
MLPDNIDVNEAYHPLQNLIDHTTSELFLDLNLHCKWGFDGSTGQSQYKQYQIIQQALMIIPVFYHISFWRKQTPSSSRFCRPIRIKYEKETSELLQDDRDEIEEQIKNLKLTSIRLLCNNLQVEVRVRHYQIDGKAVNDISKNSSPRICNICLASPIQINNDIIQKLEPKKHTLKYGLSAFHANIRFFEWILHIGYRLPIKRWDIRGQDAKKLCDAKKKQVQTEFYAL